MLKAAVIIALVALATTEKTRFDNYKVLKIIPTSSQQLQLLSELENHNGALDFWHRPSLVLQPVDVMIAPGKLDEFSNFLKSSQFSYETYVSNVQSLIDEQSPQTEKVTDADEFSFTKYHSLEEIHAWLDSLVAKYPRKVSSIDAGKSYEGRQLKGVKLSLGSASKNRSAVFIEAGIHAREWIGPATATYIINEFLTSKDPEVRALAEAHDWYVVPSVNPDGYVYSRNCNRLWRKTRSPGSNCTGTDANRNWDYMWMKAGASSDECDETFAGKSAFSEVETKSLSNYIKSVGDKLFAYLSFHSYTQGLVFPYGHTTEHLENYDELYVVSEAAANALAKRYGTNYTYGNVAERIYETSGISIDWVKATLKVPLAFTYEMRDTGNHGFILPDDQIIPNSQEVLDSLIAMFKKAAEYGYPKSHSSSSSTMPSVLPQP